MNKETEKYYKSVQDAIQNIKANDVPFSTHIETEELTITFNKSDLDFLRAYHGNDNSLVHIKKMVENEIYDLASDMEDNKNHDRFTIYQDCIEATERGEDQGLTALDYITE